MAWSREGKAWGPDLVSGLNVWLDASQLALADGAQVVTWRNFGSGTQPTFVDSLPLATFKENQANGNGVVRFGASGSRLRGNAPVGGNFEFLYVVRRWGGNVGRAFSTVYPPTNILIGFHTSYQDVTYDNGWLGPQTAWGDTGSLPAAWKLYGVDYAAGVRQFFLDGSLLGTGAASDVGNGDYCLNGLEAATGGTSETMDCDVAELLIYDHPLTEADRQSCEGYLAWKWGLQASLPVDHPYADMPPGISGGGPPDLIGALRPATAFAANLAVSKAPIVHWKLHDGSGNDLSTSGNDSTFYGGATPSTAGPTGNGAIFHGASDYVGLTSDVLTNPYVSEAVWVNTTTKVESQLAGYADGFGGATTDKDLYVRADGTVGWYVYPGGPTYTYSTIAINDGQWHHVVATYNSAGNQSLYIDGVLNATNAVNPGGSFTGYTQPNVFLGGHGAPVGQNWFVGALDDFRVYDYGLNAIEVAALYGQARFVLAGDMPPSVTLAGDMLSGPTSKYGRGSYGKGPYSAYGGPGPVDLPGNFAPLVTFAGDLSITTLAAGDLSSSVTIAGSLINIDAGLVGDLPPSIVFQAILSAYEDEGGDLRPTVTLAATLNTDMVIAGDLAPGVSLNASLQGFVDASANLAPGVAFGADTLDVVPATSFSADLAPSVVLAANLTGTFGVSANLAPSVAFNADATITPATTLQGDITPSVAFSAATTITAATALQGDLDTDISLAGDLAPLSGLLGVLAPSLTFSAALAVTPPDELAADITPQVTFQGDTIALLAALRGDLPPSTTLGADLDIVPPVELGGNLIPLASLAADPFATDMRVAGGITPVTTLGGGLDIIKELKGNLAPQATLSATLILVTPTDLHGDLPALADLSGALIAFPAIGMAGDVEATATFAMSGLEGDWVIQGDLKPSVFFTGALTGYADLTGDLAPQVAFAVKPSFDWAMFGDLAPGVALSGSIGVTPATELQGDLPPVAQFIADIDIAPPIELAGDLKPGVVLSAYLSSRVYLEADMRAQPFLGDPLNGADLGMMVDLRGNLFPLAALAAPQFGKVIGLQGDLACSTTLSDGGVGLEDYTPTSFVIIECGVF